MEDNESLREEKTVLEETIAELRYELDMKDVINDDVCFHASIWGCFHVG